MTKEELYSLYCDVLNDNISEEELFYIKLKDDDKGMIDLGLLMKRNKEKYPSLITNIDQISSDLIYIVVYYNRYSNTHDISSSFDLNYNDEYHVFNDSINFYDEFKRSIFAISKYIAYFTDEEDANKLLLHLKEKTQGDTNV